MKKTIIFSAIAIMCASCHNGKTDAPASDAGDTVVSVNDSALYGKCGDATTMHNLQLITDEGEAVEIIVDPDADSAVQGGLLAGDRLTVTCHLTDDGLVADRVVNLTTLLGHWISIDRNFEILEDGSIKSSVKAESLPYTVWQFVNANLVLNNDTFSVLTLGADSLAIENDKGIYLYKRKH